MTLLLLSAVACAIFLMGYGVGYAHGNHDGWARGYRACARAVDRHHARRRAHTRPTGGDHR